MTSIATRLWDALPLNPDPATREFECAASDYAALVDRARDLPHREFLGGVLELLGRLVASALRLPPASGWVDVDDPDAEDVERLVETGIEDHLGLSGAYWTVAPRILPDAEALPAVEVGSLGEDLAEIYGAILVGLGAARNGDYARAAALWRSSFFMHWGRHALEASRAIFAVLDE